MSNYRAIVIVVALALLNVYACERQPAERGSQVPVPVVRLVHTWGIDTSTTAQLQIALAGSLRDMRVELNRETNGPATALLMLRRGEVDAVFTFTSFAYMALTGQSTERTGPSDHLRAIAELPSRPVQVVVGPRSGITSVAALRGRRLSFGPTGSNAALIAELLLGAFGISVGEVKAERLELHDATRRIITGELDAVFSNGYTSADIADALLHGARMLQIEGTEVDRSRAIYPLLKPTVIRGGTYPTIDHAIHTVGVDEIFLCRSDLDERIAHELTRAFVEVVARGDVNIEPLRFMNLSAASSTAIPLHPGAARYYRERELLP